MRIVQFFVVLTALTLSSAGVWADAAAQAQAALAEGQTLLEAGDFDGALQAFKTAARADRTNAEHGQEYALLRQVMQLRKRLPNEKDAERWMTGASALHTYYHEHGLYWESLQVDAERFRRDASAESAILLARTQLALDMPSATDELLVALPDEKGTPHTRVLHGLALARLGRVDEAKSAIGKVRGDVPDTPEYFLDLARTQALLGVREGAFQSIKRTLELTPPSRLADRRDPIAKGYDFKAIADTPEFAEVLKTPSTIKESPCSGGSGCSKCPKRGGCAGAKSADDKPKTP